VTGFDRRIRYLSGAYQGADFLVKLAAKFLRAKSTVSRAFSFAMPAPVLA